MLRFLPPLLATLLIPAAFAQGFLDRMVDRDREAYHREQIEVLASGGDVRKRVEAAQWLAVQAEPRDVEALAAALGDREARVRQAAASGLWKMEKRAEPARGALQRALGDEDPNVVVTVAGALRALDVKDEALAEARRRVLASPQATGASRFQAARGLVGFAPATELVAPMLDFLDAWGRPNAAFRLTDAGEKNVEMADGALEKLVTHTQDRKAMAMMVEALETGRGGAVTLIHTLGLFEPRPPGWTAVLLRQLDSPNPYVRDAVLAQVRNLKGEADVAAFVPRVTALLDDRVSLVRASAMWTLERAGGLATTAVPRIEQALNDPDESVRNRAAEALKAIRSAQPEFAAGTPREAAAKQVLRARGVKFAPDDFSGALRAVDVELMRAYLDAGMSAKEPIGSSGTPIRLMLFMNNAACVQSERPTKAATLQAIRLLLERGADPNAGDNNGNTPLMAAAMGGCDREVIRTLLKAGAQMGAKNSAGLSAFEIAVYSGNDGLEELIAAGYRMPPDKARAFAEGYKDRPASLALIRKASAPAPARK